MWLILEILRYFYDRSVTRDWCEWIQFIPGIMHMFYVLLCIVMVWYISCLYPSALCHGRQGNYALWWPPCQWNIPDEIMCKRITPPSWTNWSPFRIDLIKCIFSTKGFISLMFVSKGQIDNKWALVQVMAWRRTGAKPLSEAMLIKFTYVYMRTRGRLVKRTHQATIYKKK